MSWHSKSFARQLLILFVTATSMLAASAEAQAFCGFYVSGAGGNLYNSATQVVMMREGTQTVLSMRNNYQGPPEDFAMVVPVPQVLSEESVKILHDDIFDKVDTLAAPRLVEYWEHASCPGHRGSGKKTGRTSEIDNLYFELESKNASSATTIEAKFTVGEYDVVILSAAESNGLEKWLLDNKYNIPKGASKVMAQYIAQGMYFFVAKVNADKVTFDSKGNALLSPLRFHYDSHDFSLPVRLGLLNAKGPQDLIVHILSRKGRYHAANYPNVSIPTNIVVPEKTNFGAFYEELFSFTLKHKPGAVVTEYAWIANSCDPCPGPVLSKEDLMILGTDVLSKQPEKRVGLVRSRDVRTSQRAAKPHIDSARGAMLRGSERFKICYDPLLESGSNEDGEVLLEITFSKSGEAASTKVLGKTLGDQTMEECIAKQAREISLVEAISEPLTFRFKLRFYQPPPPPWNINSSNWTLTRLHARYTDKTMTEDLIFEKAQALVGGRGVPKVGSGRIDPTVRHGGAGNFFQGRYIVLHRNKAKLACEEEKQYRYWGGPTSNARAPKTSSAPRMTPSSEKTKYALPLDLQNEASDQLKVQETDR